jgi:AraC-like DNA-binding protein
MFKFGAAVDEVVFAPPIADTPVVGADPYLNELLISQFEEELSRWRTKRGSFRAVAKNAIAPLLPHGNARESEIARRCGLSRRTFMRRLTSPSLTFSEVLHDMKRDMAALYLADHRLSISQIAWLLGIREPADSRMHLSTGPVKLLGRHGSNCNTRRKRCRPRAMCSPTPPEVGTGSRGVGPIRLSACICTAYQRQSYRGLMGGKIFLLRAGPPFASPVDICSRAPRPSSSGSPVTLALKRATPIAAGPQTSLTHVPSG